MNSGSLILVLTLFSVPIISSSELKLVQVLCRHGDRAPLPGYQEWYPTDPHINQEYEPEGLGELTADGRRRSFELGQFLRSRYFSTLRISEYSSAQFSVRSSNADRCKKSAESVLAALFPGSEAIPIHYQELKDALFVGTHICPTIGAEMDRAERSMRRFEDEQRWASLREYLSTHLGVNATRYHAFILHHTLIAQRAFGLPLPEWTKKIYPSEDLDRYSGYQYVLQSYNNKLKRINGGLWIREFIENMNNVASGKVGSKMLLYVGHETNLAGFLSALGVFEPHVPGFSSCVILEMYQDSHSEEFYARLFYKNYDKLEELYVPRCSLPCSLADFKYLTKNVIPENANQECGWAA